MLVESLELSLAHVGVGTLSEVSLVELFATAQAHALVQGTGHTLHHIRDCADNRLYPAFYYTHLVVPPTRRLEVHRVWDRVSIGVDVAAYGKFILESRYVLAGSEERLGEAWEPDIAARLPSMRSNSLFVLDDRAGEPQLSSPLHGTIAPLRALGQRPQSMDRLRKVQAAGLRCPGSTVFAATIERALVPGIDAAPDGFLVFSKFIELAVLAEYTVLERQRMPQALLDARSVLEREVYYFANCRASTTLSIDVEASLERCEPHHSSAEELVYAGLVNSVVEIRRGDDNLLLAIARGRSLFVVPKNQGGTLREAERWMTRHGGTPRSS